MLNDALGSLKLCHTETHIDLDPLLTHIRSRDMALCVVLTPNDVVLRMRHSEPEVHQQATQQTSAVFHPTSIVQFSVLVRLPSTKYTRDVPMYAVSTTVSI